MDAEVTESTPPAKPDRTLLAILIVVGLLVVIALVVVLVRGGEKQVLDPTTPEGVVQRYAQAVIDHDDEAAGKYLAERSDECEYYYGQSEVDLRLTFKSTDIEDDNATVQVSISTTYGGDPFSNQEYSTDGEFTLVRSGESWLIESTPYEFLSCGAEVGK